MNRPPLLYLAHRIPFPPNKGDKVRSFNILRQLSRHYRVYLATFIDQPEDREHLGALDQWCEEVFAAHISPRRDRLRSLRGLLAGEALTVPYYRNRALAQWVRERVAAHRIERAVVFSGAMAQYLETLPEMRTVIDFCDVDSAKWTQYAAQRIWPMSWLYRREGEQLFKFERRWADRASVSTFVTAAERDLFLEQAPECAASVQVLENGVDADYFSPALPSTSPFPEARSAIVFSGAMDYWPNIDAVCWFASEVLPLVREQRPDAMFVIVGMNPAPAVRALVEPGVVEVTGTVPDVRPYVGHADVVVAPLRVARGIQNKVLEAMSLARPVVVSSAAAEGLNAQVGVDYRSATSAREFADEVLALLDPGVGEKIGRAARSRVLENYSWDAQLGVLRALLESPGEAAHEPGEACA